MIDIHSHIIFGVDDGAENLKETMDLVEESYRQGVRTIVATPHRREGMFEIDINVILENFETIKEKVAEKFPKMEIYLGCEVYYKEGELRNIELKKYPTLAGTDYLLVEFNYGISYREMNKALNGILLLGLTPVIAHIERYECLAETEKRIEELINMGCYMQVNAESVLKPKLLGDGHRLYKKRAKYYLDKELVHFIATDMHNMTTRKPLLEAAYTIIEKKYGEDVAYNLFEGNQKLLLANKMI